MKKLVFVVPHLSTGGLPQYLYKQIESLYNEYEIYCLEWDNHTGGKLVVQRNKIEALLNNRLITIGDNRDRLHREILAIKPDIVHFQEIPEYFVPYELAKKIYANGREYKIIETSHDSSFDITNKLHYPDKFMMVSQYQINEFQKLGIPTELIEYPIEYKDRIKSRDELLKELGLNPNYKHVVNIGLFTPRKNQAEIIEYARELESYPIQFHFIGNQADNFKYYWEPIMENLPSNCKWWNERTDVDTFYQIADLFLFTSRGHDTDKETMPLVIRESLGWKIPSLIYNLPVYLNYFDKYDTISYLDFTNTKNNITKILNALELDSDINADEEIFIISTYPDTTAITNTTIECIKSIKAINRKCMVVSHYPIPINIQNEADYVLYDSNNLLVEHDYYKYAWTNQATFDMNINITGEKNNMYHGAAVYTNYVNGANYAQKLGYTNAFFINFDYTIKDADKINSISSNLKKNNGVLIKKNTQEGDTYETYFMAFNLNFFTKKFEYVSTPSDYANLTLSAQSNSNGLERIMYLKLENENILNIDANYADTILTNTYFSRVEYLTVLDTNIENTMACVWWSSNVIDSRKLSIEIIVNGIVEDSKSFNITSFCISYLLFNYENCKQFKIRYLLSELNGNKISEKIIEIDEEYINTTLKTNGILTKKNIK